MLRSPCQRPADLPSERWEYFGRVPNSPLADNLKALYAPGSLEPMQTARSLIDDDVLHTILGLVSDFQTFLAWLTTSKAFFNVFNDYRNTTLRRIAINLVGSSTALEHALELVRYSKPDPAEDQDELDMSYFEHLPDIGKRSGQPVTVRELGQLQGYADVVNQLQDIFSFRRKDKRFSQSVLTRAESDRFLRALYRVWLYQRCFDFLHLAYASDEDRIGDGEQLAGETLPSRIQFLTRYRSQELREMQQVVLFLQEPAEKVDGEIWERDFILARGPKNALSIMTTRAFWKIWGNGWYCVNEFITGYFSDPLERIFADMHESLEADANVILDEQFGQEDKCEHCGTIKGIDLWNRTNWNFFAPFCFSVSHLEISNWLPGRLGDNPDEKQQIETYFYETIEFADFIRAIFVLKGKEYSSWTDEQWTCGYCLVGLMEDTILKFWIDKKAKEGMTIPAQACSNGWDCELQVRDTDHARTLNHFCAPS